MDAHGQQEENISERSGELMDELLRRAVIEGRIETLKFRILQQRFDLNARDAGGHTPLMLAARNGRTAICRMLVQQGVDLHATLHGKTALDMAHDNGMTNVVSVICEAAGIEIPGSADDGTKASAPIKPSSEHGRAENINIKNVSLDALSDFGSFAGHFHGESGQEAQDTPEEQGGAEDSETTDDVCNAQEQNESAVSQQSDADAEPLPEDEMPEWAGSVQDKGQDDALDDAPDSVLGNFEPEINEPLPQSDEALKFEAHKVQSAISKHVPQSGGADFDWDDSGDFSNLDDVSPESGEISTQQHKDTTPGNLREVVSAISLGKEAVVRDFLENHGDVNARDAGGYTLLMLAAYGNHPRICRLLLEYGADPKATREGETALDMAQKSSATFAANAIRETMRAKPHKASIPEADKVAPRLSPAGVASKSGSMDTRLHFIVAGSGKKEDAEFLLRHLVARGVDLNARDEDGYTPLMLAAKGNMDSICRLLVENGADVLVERAGMTALNLAQESGANEAFRIIREATLKAITHRKQEKEGRHDEAPAAGYSNTAAVRSALENIEIYMSGKEPFPYGMRAFPALLAECQVPGLFNNVMAAARVHVVMTFCKEEGTVEHTVSSSTVYKIFRDDLPSNQNKLRQLAQQFTGWRLTDAVVRNTKTGMVFPLIERRPPVNHSPVPAETQPSNVQPLHAHGGVDGEMDLSLKRAVLTGNETTLLECIPRCDDLNVRDAGGYTALMLAAGRNHAGTCRLLIRHGADIFALRDGKTALDMAHDAGAIEVEIVLQSAIEK